MTEKNINQLWNINNVWKHLLKIWRNILTDYLKFTFSQKEKSYKNIFLLEIIFIHIVCFKFPVVSFKADFGSIDI